MTARGTVPVLPNSRLHRLLLAAGLAGAVLFPVVFLLDGAVRPGYDSLTEPISDLATGPGAGVQIANFITYGALAALSSIGWRTSLVPGAASAAYPVLRLITGLALIATGIFHRGVSHDIVAYTSLIATVTGLFVLARRLHREPGWRGWAPYAVATAILMMSLLAVFGSLVRYHEGGVFEKLATIAGVLFTVLLTARVLTRQSRITATGH